MKNKLTILILSFLLVLQTISTAAFAGVSPTSGEVVTKRKIPNNIDKTVEITRRQYLPTEEWRNLRTTSVPGVFQKDEICPKCSIGLREYYYYNTVKRQMVNVTPTMNIPSGYTLKPNSNAKIYFEPMTSTGNLYKREEEFLKYGNKNNIIKHNGNVYIISEPEPQKRAQQQKNTPAKQTPTQYKTLPVEKWKTLRTYDGIPGIFNRVDRDEIYTNEYYFYNTRTKQMIEIPTNKKYISSTKDLGSLEKEFRSYANKTGIIKHNGKKYVIHRSAPERYAIPLSKYHMRPTGEIPYTIHYDGPKYDEIKNILDNCK